LVPPVEEDDAAEDTSFGPVPDAVSHTFGVLIIVAIPWVTKENSGKSVRIDPLEVVRGTPSAKGVDFMPVSILCIKPSSDVVDGPGDKLNEPGGKARRLPWNRLVVAKELRSRPISKMSKGLLSNGGSLPSKA